MCCPGAGPGTINFGLYARLQEMGQTEKAVELAPAANPAPAPSYTEQNLKVILQESKKSGGHAYPVASVLGIYPC